MANNNRTKGYDGDDRPTYQFTSYQLVMAICAVLLLMVLVFMAGSFVQGLDGPRTNSSEEAIGSSSDQDSALADKKPEKPKPMSSIGTQARREEGVQVSPKPVTISPQGSPSGTSATKPSTPVKTSQSSGPAYIPAPPPSRTSGKSTASALGSKEETVKKDANADTAGGDQNTMKKPEVTSVAPPASPGPAPTSKASVSQTDPAKTESGATPPSAGMTETPQKTVEPDKTQVAKSDSATPAAAGNSEGGFTVQVASFEATKRDVVDAYVKRIKSNSDFDVRILPTKDNSRLRICIGQFTNKNAADKARDDLRSIKEFQDCWVLALNE